MNKKVKVVISSLLWVTFVCGMVMMLMETINKPTNDFPKNTKILSYQTSAKHLLKIYEKLDERTYYCGRPLSSVKKELEHISPVSSYKDLFPEWEGGHKKCVTSTGVRYKGRRCAQKVSKQFRYLTADMHNLAWASKYYNQTKKARRFNEIPGETSIKEGCDFEISKRFVEPSDNRKGDVARVVLYMRKAYRKNSPTTPVVLLAWNLRDPVDKTECLKSFMIEQIQKNPNPYIKKPCQEAGLWPSSAEKMVK